MESNETKQKAPRETYATMGTLSFDRGGKNIQKQNKTKQKPSHFIKWCWSKIQQCWENWATMNKTRKLEHVLNHTQKLTQNGVKT